MGIPLEEGFLDPAFNAMALRTKGREIGGGIALTRIVREQPLGEDVVHSRRPLHDPAASPTFALIPLDDLATELAPSWRVWWPEATTRFSTSLSSSKDTPSHAVGRACGLGTRDFTLSLLVSAHDLNQQLFLPQ